MQIVTVRPGETVYSIARRYAVDPARIIADNQISEPNRLVIGQALVVNINNLPYTVQRGDTFYTIARRYGITTAALMAANPGIPPNRLQPGMVLTIPAPPKLGTILVNGYAFPNITDEVLAQTLPYLSYLSIFSYEVQASGDLTPIPDERLITAARAANVAPMMVITNLEPGGGFSSTLANQILQSVAVQQRLINNIVRVLEQKNYYGLDVDFEYIYPDDRLAYNAFLQRIADRIKPMGYTLTTAVAPKIREDQPGILYQGHDYRFHGQVADHVIIMTYEWGYT